MGFLRLSQFPFTGFRLNLTERISREKRERRVFDSLLQMVPGLEQRLLESSDDGQIDSWTGSCQAAVVFLYSRIAEDTERCL
jgi:hypothetical protein